MSDDNDETLIQGPMPDPEFVADRARQVRRAAEEVESRRQGDEIERFMASLSEIAGRQEEAFAALPCRGAIERIPECSAGFEQDCERRESPSCPRRIRAFEIGRARAELEQRLIELNVEKPVADRFVRLVAGNVELTALLLRLIVSGVPLDSVETLIGPFKVTRATAAVDAFLANQSKHTLVLAGEVGVGKSVGAAHAIRRRPGRFMTCSQLAKIGRFGDDADALRRLAYGAPLLVIDDLGMEYGDGKGWFQSVLEPLIIDRHDRLRESVITCNLTWSDFVPRYGARIADRLRGAGMFIQLKGASLRTVEAVGTKASAGGKVVAIVLPRAWFARDGAVALACAAPFDRDHDITTARARQVVALAAINGALRRKGPRRASGARP